MATVSGGDSKWENSGQLLVGDIGNGELTITGGGAVSAFNPIIAAQKFSTGTATVAGADSRWTATGFLGIGGNALTRMPGGTGTLRIQPGGMVTGPLEIVVFDGGHLTLEGGALSTRTFAFANGANAASNFSWTSGTLQVVEFFGNLVNQAGVLAPSSSAGASISGDYSQLTAATLQIEIGGVASTAFDRVRVAGGITLLGGDLEVSLINGFVPSSTDAFTVLSTQIGSFTGSFDNVASGQRLTTSDGLGSFLVSYGPGSPQVVLSTFLPALGGDFDSDGDVDGGDFLVWQRGGSPNANSATDLAAWRANFGFPGLVATGTALPELDSALMAWALVILASLSQRICIHAERVAANRAS
jgi:T5SS/PEP-CTERM-associated repeat protein